jgi:hypothetical protein
MIRYDPSLDLGAKNPLNSALDINLVLEKLVGFVQDGNCEQPHTKLSSVI